MKSPDGKLRRAKQHLESFRDEVSVLEDLDSHTIIVEDDPDTSQYVFKVHGIKSTSPDLGLLAGDCIHNLRTALDHLVFQLAILGQGRDLTGEEAGSCSFPIYDDPSKFPHPGKRDPIKLLRSGEQTRITELQPFNAWNPSIWGLSHQSVIFGRMYPAQIPGQLTRLSDLDNIDKHRTVHAAWQGTSFIATLDPPPPFRLFSVSTGPLKDEAEIGRWSYPTPKPELPADMDMNRYFPISVVLAEPSLVNNAVELLNGLVDVVSIVLELFRPCIEVGAASLPLSSIPA